MRPLLLALLISWPSPSWAPEIPKVSFYEKVMDGHTVKSCEILRKRYEAEGVEGICK